MLKDRSTFLNDFYDQGKFFLEAPVTWDMDSIRPKWNDEKRLFFDEFLLKLQSMETWDATNLESVFKNLAMEKKIKAGDLLQPFRIMLVGEKKGPPVFEIAAALNREETISRIEKLLAAI
jgi:glutamyl-tRNA synthetase